MPPAIPPRQPVEDRFAGYHLQVQGETLLAVSNVSTVTDATSGEWIIRYGIRFLGKPHLSIVPGLVAVDYGQMFSGEEAWQFLLKRSNLYPRAEVFGYRNDGRDEMMYVKNLDFVQPVEVLLFSDPQSPIPAARPKAIIASEQEAGTLPPRLIEYLPRYASVDAWQSAQNHT